jgi:hypothetical protein
VRDRLPAPYGAVTARFTLLDPEERDRQSVRLLGVVYRQARIVKPDRVGCDHYRQLAIAAVAGDEVALGWLATSHRALLLARGRILFDHDPVEWGATALELLYRTLVRANPAAGVWLRRQVVVHLSTRMLRVVDAHIVRVRVEQLTDPQTLRSAAATVPGPADDPHPQLTVELHRALAGLPGSTVATLCASAGREPLDAIVAETGLSEATLRQRATRARRQLRVELAGLQRGR